MSAREAIPRNCPIRIERRAPDCRPQSITGRVLLSLAATHSLPTHASESIAARLPRWSALAASGWWSFGDGRTAFHVGIASMQAESVKRLFPGGAALGKRPPALLRFGQRLQLIAIQVLLQAGHAGGHFGTREQLLARNLAQDLEAQL
jgi:hypothetical protein